MILSNGTDTEGEEKFYRSLFGGEDKVIELMKNVDMVMMNLIA